MRYQYDELLRLIEADEHPGATYAYSYDDSGNRTGVWVNGTRTITLTHDAANQVSGWSYDAAGNLIGDGSATMTYDALSRTKAVTITATSQPRHNSYTGDGVLLKRIANGTTTHYIQDLASPLSQVLQTTGPATTHHIYGLDRLASKTSSTRTWYLHDALGSVRRSMNNSGASTGIVFYDPWGTPESGTVPTFGFTGELQDVATGMVNLRARWYSTPKGTFTSKDPFAGLAEQPYSLHPYQYAYSDPALNTDPSGRDPNEQCGGIYSKPCSEEQVQECVPFDLRAPMNPNACPPEVPPPPRKLLAVEQLIKDIWDFSIHPEAQAIGLRRSVGLGLPMCQITLPGLDAYRRWYNFVKTGGELDVKKRYLRDFGSKLSLFVGEKKGWTYQLTGNLLYGFVGLHVHFTETELLDAAGAAQYMDHCVDRHNPDSVGPGAPNCDITNWSPRSWDNPSDQAAVKAGFALYREFGSLFLSPYPEKLVEKLRALERILMRYRDRIPEMQ